MRPKLTLAAIAAAATLSLTGTAQAQTPSQALAGLAQHATHGWVDDAKPLPVLEHKLNQGRRIYVTCGTISRLAVRKMQRMGVPARLVGAVTTDKPNGVDDGHILMEARLDGRWQVFDLDNNRKPVDATGHGITISQFVAQTNRYYKPLAHDRGVSWAGRPDLKARFAWIHDSEAGLQRWYDHILGAPAIYTGSGWATPMGRRNSQMRTLGYTPVTAAAFAALAS